MLQEYSNNYQEKVTQLINLLSSPISAGSDETSSNIENFLIEIFSSMQTESVLTTTFIEQLLIQLSAQSFLELFTIIERHDQLQKFAKQIRFALQDAEQLASATVHWLRHTGISEDVKIRPREHVRDDAGHSSGAITDKYIDVELRARHGTARKKG